LSIGSITADGEQLEYLYSPHFQNNSEDDRRWSSVKCCSSAADAGSSIYITTLAKEASPNLVIQCQKCLPFLSNGKVEETTENGASAALNNSEEQTTHACNGHSEEKVKFP
jgi:transcription initiation factor TFIID subunit 2